MVNRSALFLRLEALRLLRDRQYDKSLTVFDYIVREFADAHDYVWLGLLRLLNGDYHGATREFCDCVVLLPDDLSCHHHLAAIRSSCPIDALRDGQLAMGHAERVAAIRPTHTWRSLSVLAACHAENGDFDSAISCAEDAFDISHTDYRGILRSRIDDYRHGIPYRISQKDLKAAVEIREHRCATCDKIDFVIWEQNPNGYTPRCLECAEHAE